MQRVYECPSCGSRNAKWVPRCSCGGWTKAITIAAEEAPRFPRLVADQPGGAYAAHGASSDSDGRANAPISPAADAGRSKPIPITSAQIIVHPRVSTGIEAVDRVLGGGIAERSATLLGGDPGAGKSTLLSQLMRNVVAGKDDRRVLYASGEETIGQIAERADRLGARHDRLYLITETDVDAIFRAADDIGATLVALDSIQTMFDPQCGSVVGSIAQIRSVAARARMFAKDECRKTSVIVIGHITKDGKIAGPETLQHEVDVTLHLSPMDEFPQLRMLKAFKNRFGSTVERGIMEMVAKGLIDTDAETNDRVTKSVEWQLIAQELLDRWQIQGGTPDAGIIERIGGRLDLDAWRANV